MVIGVIISVVISAILTMAGDCKLQDRGVKLGCGGLLGFFLLMFVITFIPICILITNL